MKNRIIVLAISILLVWTTAFAETTIESVDTSEGTITVTGTTDSNMITYKVYNSELQPSSLKNTDIVGFGEEYFESENFGVKNDSIIYVIYLLRERSL